MARMSSPARLSLQVGRSLETIMLNFLGDDRMCSSENKELAVAKLCFMWPDYG
jgi:hypothetical protein